MCGIAGILKLHNPGDGPPPHPLDAIPERWLDILDESIKHRGPDGAARFRDRATRRDGTVVDIALVHRRLSIIDHAGGHQPMVHDGSRLRPDLTYAPGDTPILAHQTAPNLPLVAVVFNGCIYNHRELRNELEASGQVFETDHSDTEAIIHAWRNWGHWTYDRIAESSMFAIGLWDRATGTLATARDLFGQKPIYVSGTAMSGKTEGSRNPPAVAISSNPAGLAALYSLDQLRPDALSTWIAFGHNLHTTPYRFVASMAPHTLHVTPFDEPDDGKSRLDKVIDALAELKPPDAPERVLPRTYPRSFTLSSLKSLGRKLAPNIDALVRQSVSEKLEADVPIACLLSGGVDSSLIAHHAQELTGNIQTISVRMPDARYDESQYARAIAEHIGSAHIEVETKEHAAEDLIFLIERSGLPFGDSSLLPTYWACSAASDIATVLLTGDGGDELFVGYQRQLSAKWLGWGSLIGPAFHLFPVTHLHGRSQFSKGEKARRFIESMRRGSYYTLLAIFGPKDARRLISSIADVFPSRDAPWTAHDAAYNDALFTLPSDYLRKVDLASMAVPVETRAPLLDKRLQDAAIELGPANYAGGLKAVLRQTAKLHLPDHIIDRPKQGFAIPIGEWFRTDYGRLRQLLHDHLRSTDPFPGLADAGVSINMAFVEQMLAEHDAAGEKSINPWHGRDHSQRLYMLLVLSIWAKSLDRVRRGEP